MLIPKASHLVERVAERLLRSGDLDDSAAQLLRPPNIEFGPEREGERTVNGSSEAAGSQHAAAQAEAQQRVSLFKPAPRTDGSGTAEPAIPDLVSPPSVSDGRKDEGLSSKTQAEVHLQVGDTETELVSAPFGSPTVRPIPPPVVGFPQAPVPGQVTRRGVLDRPWTGSNPAGVSSDPAEALVRGPSAVDALSLERAGMLDWSRTRTRISEEFRLVQRQIIRSAFGPGAEPGFSNLLLVTSARPGEGKSFMATNLAGSIARQGDHYVLLVDADPKRDSICYSLGLTQAGGLLDLAANPKLDPAPLIVKTPIERLSILPVGCERDRSGELFSTKEMTRVIQNLGRRYADRLLILDAPPCLSTSDPAVLAQAVGQILFVVEANRTQRDEVEASLDLIQACPTITLVLNKQQVSSRYTFGAYSPY
jgi:protein-tyrosine kinase